MQRYRVKSVKWNFGPKGGKLSVTGWDLCCDDCWCLFRYHLSLL